MEFFNYQSLFFGLLLATLNPIQAMERDEYYGINEMAITGHAYSPQPTPIAPSTAGLPKQCGNNTGSSSHSAC